MRLFVAIRFPAPAEERFAAAVERLREGSRSGTFTRRENLHLTLAFLGETARFTQAKRAVSAVRSRPFELVFEGLGSFRRGDGDIVWIGARQNGRLEELHRSLTRALEAEGFRLDGKPFRPHLTLGRRVLPAPEFDRGAFAASLPPVAVRVDCIALMESGRVQGRLVYTARMVHKLTEEETR